MKGKGGALMIVLGKKPGKGMGSEKPSSPSLGSESEDEGMDVGAALKAYESAKAKGNWAKAAEAFKMAVRSCGGYEKKD